MTTLTKTVRRVTQDTYGCGRKARKLVVARIPINGARSKSPDA